LLSDIPTVSTYAQHTIDLTPHTVDAHQLFDVVDRLLSKIIEADRELAFDFV
jgi:hypothetical protein